MKPEDRSKLQSLVSEIEGLKSREPLESKFKDWKEKVEKKLEEVFGKGSDQLSRFRRVRFFEFGGRGRPASAPLTEQERRDYLAGLEAGRRELLRFL